MSVHFSEFFVVFPSSSSPLVLSENQRNKIREEGVEEGEEGGTSRGIERREERREREREREDTAVNANTSEHCNDH